MPCMGPNLDDAVIEARKAYDKLIEMLEKEFHVDGDPTNLEFNTQWVNRQFTRQKREARERLKKDLEELFIAHWCESF